MSRICKLQQVIHNGKHKNGKWLEKKMIELNLNQIPLSIAAAILILFSIFSSNYLQFLNLLRTVIDTS
jgi:hypothetical protein